MGQTQSVASEEPPPLEAAKAVAETPVNPPPPSSSMESLIAEALSQSDDEDESLDVKAQKALDCPCVAELRNGPCGTAFSEAFVCFIKSTSEEKGSDCVKPFIALQNCIKANPDAFPLDVLDEEGGDGDENKQVEDLKIQLPEWSKEPKSKN